MVRLLYTNSGVGVLALGSNGVQKLWKWTRNEQNPSGKVIASCESVSIICSFFPSIFDIFLKSVNF